MKLRAKSPLSMFIWCGSKMKLSLRYGHAEHSDEILNEAIGSVLQANILMSIASQKEGQSYINTAYFAFNDKLDIFFLSNPESQHGANIAATPSVALSIFDSRQEWDQSKKGLQLFGACRPAHGFEVLHGGRLYAGRFASFGKVIGHLPDLLSNASRFKVYVVDVKTLKYLDEERFGPHTSVELGLIKD